MQATGASRGGNPGALNNCSYGSQKAVLDIAVTTRNKEYILGESVMLYSE